METIRALIQRPDAMFWVVVVGVPVVSWAIIEIVKMSFRHKERMVMINRGMHPDQYPDSEEETDEQDQTRPREANAAARVS